MTELVISKKAYFATVDGRKIAQYGYSINALEDHLKDHAMKEDMKDWCDLHCASRAFGMRATEENRKLTRGRFSRAATSLLGRGILLLKKYGGHGDLQEVKIYDRTSEADLAWATEQYQIAQERGEESAEKLETMARIINDLPEPAIGVDADRSLSEGV